MPMSGMDTAQDLFEVCAPSFGRKTEWSPICCHQFPPSNFKGAADDFGLMRGRTWLSCGEDFGEKGETIINLEGSISSQKHQKVDSSQGDVLAARARSGICAKTSVRSEPIFHFYRGGALSFWAQFSKKDVHTKINKREFGLHNFIRRLRCRTSRVLRRVWRWCRNTPTRSG